MGRIRSTTSSTSSIVYLGIPSPSSRFTEIAAHRARNVPRFPAIFIGRLSTHENGTSQPSFEAIVMVGRWSKTCRWTWLVVGNRKLKLYYRREEILYEVNALFIQEMYLIYWNRRRYVYISCIFLYFCSYYWKLKNF